MRRHIITSIFLALICAQMAQGKQAKPAKIRASRIRLPSKSMRLVECESGSSPERNGLW